MYEVSLTFYLFYFTRNFISKEHYLIIDDVLSKYSQDTIY